MQTLINICVTFVLMFWPILLMMSPMMFDAPGSENNKNHFITMMLFLCYPIGIFFLYWVFGATYFGVSGFTLTWISCVVIFSAFTIFGYFGMLSNLHRGIANTGYSIAENKVYYSGKLVENADSESFVILTENEYPYSIPDHAWDRQHFYYMGKTIEGAIADNIRRKEVANRTYWVNESQVIYDDKILPGARPDNFAGFDGFTGWSFSDNNDQYLAFSYGIPLPAVDKTTFTPLNDFLAKDKYQIFEKNQPILPDADAESFELLDDHIFGKDKNYIYYISTKVPFAIKDVDPSSFELLDRGYLKDKNGIYHVIQYERIEKIEQADVATFQATRYDEASKSDARDINHFYYNGKIGGKRKEK